MEQRVISKPVGILGGMGPEATILLQQKLMRALPDATRDEDHIPLIIDRNPQVPSRIAHLINGTGDDPSPVLASMARRLESAGATALAMPCNTAHHYAVAIQNAVDIPFLHMVELSAAYVNELDTTGARVGMLASPAVRLTGLFDKALAPFHKETLWPSDGDKMLEAIQLIKKQGPTEAANTILQEASDELAAAGAMVQVIACSEFSLFAFEDTKVAGVEFIDTIDVLVESIVSHAIS